MKRADIVPNKGDLRKPHARWLEISVEFVIANYEEFGLIFRNPPAQLHILLDPKIARIPMQCQRISTRTDEQLHFGLLLDLDRSE